MCHFSITIWWEAERTRLKAEKQREALNQKEKQIEKYLCLAEGKEKSWRMHFSKQGEGRRVRNRIRWQRKQGPCQSAVCQGISCSQSPEVRAVLSPHFTMTKLRQRATKRLGPASPFHCPPLTMLREGLSKAPSTQCVRPKAPGDGSHCSPLAPMQLFSNFKIFIPNGNNKSEPSGASVWGLSN